MKNYSCGLYWRENLGVVIHNRLHRLVLLSLLILAGCSARMDTRGSGGSNNSGSGFQKPEPLPPGVTPPGALPEKFLGAVSAVNFEIPSGVPMAGYGGLKRRSLDIHNRHPYAHYFKPSRGVLDPVRGKVMALKKNDSLLIWVSIDLVAVEDKMRKDLIERLRAFGVNEMNFMLSATHTHSGPGALSHNPLWQLMAVDRLSRQIYNQFLEQIENLVVQTILSLEPVDLYKLSVPMSGLQANRLHSGGDYDNLANSLLLRSEKRFLGGLTFFPIHGTSLKQKNLKLSADAPGAIEASLENKFKELNSDNMPVTFALVQSALGDVKPTYENEAGLKKLRAEFAEQMINKISDDNMSVLTGDIHTEYYSVQLGKAHLTINNCINNEFIDRALMKELKVNLDKYLPKVAEVWKVTIAGQEIWTWPGEPTTAIGRKMMTKGEWVASLTNNYLGYFTTDKEYKMKGTEPCSSLYGRDGAQKIVDYLRTHNIR